MSATSPLFLLIDDNDIDIFLNKKLLLAGDITQNILSFNSGNDALAYLAENADIPDKLPSIILLDVLMPEMNGFQFLEHFEHLPDSVKSVSKIIMLSSTIDPQDLERARSCKYVLDILKKPLNTTDLTGLLEQLK